MHQSLLIYTPKISSRHQYIFKVLFSEIYSIEYSLTENLEYYTQSNNFKINYSNSIICEDELFVKHSGLLNQKGINQIDLKIENINDTPCFFLTDDKNSYHFDLFAASFYLITRYEEYLPHLKDKYNRYIHKESIAFKNGFLRKPIVNLWMKYFILELQSYFPKLKIHSPSFKYISTIDIDNAYLFKGKSFVRSVAFLFRSIMNFDFDKISMYFSVIFNRRKDPFDTYSFQFNLQKKYNLDVRYFILIGDYGLNDKNISYTNKSFQMLIKRLSDFAKIGLHPSYGSTFNHDKIAIERKRLEDIQKREVKSSRQHFLQLSFPNTYRRLINIGITNDYTMGYASDLGFRAGIATPYTFYNLDTEEILAIKVYPFAIVDDTLRYNMKLNACEVLDNIKDIIQSVKDVNGTLITIWHNDTFSEKGIWKGWKNIYEEMIKLIKNK